MILKPQDILVLLKLVAKGASNWAYNNLAVELGMSPSEVHAAVQRAIAARLAMRAADRIGPNISRLGEFLIHGIQYVFIPDRGELTRGIPTSYAAPPLLDVIVASDEPPPVWPDPSGTVRGQAFSPLYKAVPLAARNDPQLYELLVLVDAIRGGGARIYQLAVEQLSKRLRKFDGENEPES
ncbi:MAG: hypothetical protein WAU91_14735 [Desulfatitalea sp.]